MRKGILYLFSLFSNFLLLFFSNFHFRFRNGINVWIHFKGTVNCQRFDGFGCNAIESLFFVFWMKKKCVFLFNIIFIIKIHFPQNICLCACLRACYTIWMGNSRWRMPLVDTYLYRKVSNLRHLETFPSFQHRTTAMTVSEWHWKRFYSTFFFIPTTIDFIKLFYFIFLSFRASFPSRLSFWMVFGGWNKRGKNFFQNERRNAMTHA